MPVGSDEVTSKSIVLVQLADTVDCFMRQPSKLALPILNILMALIT